MRTYYRRFLAWAGLNVVAALSGVVLAVWQHSHWWAVVAQAIAVLWFALRAYRFGKAARTARKYIGHPLEYLVMVQLEFGKR